MWQKAHRLAVHAYALSEYLKERPSVEHRRGMRARIGPRFLPISLVLDGLRERIRVRLDPWSRHQADSPGRLYPTRERTIRRPLRSDPLDPGSRSEGRDASPRVTKEPAEASSRKPA